MLKETFLLICLFFTVTLSSKELTLQPFETDHCTFFFDGTSEAPTLWQHCCDIHDLKYWVGGSIPARDRADRALKACVEKVAGPDWASLIYYGVKLGHLSPIKARKKWNWGWTLDRDESELSSEEQEKAIAFLRLLYLEKNFNKDYVETAIAEQFSSQTKN